MKLDKINKPPAESEEVVKPRLKAVPTKYEGNRFGSLILLIVTVLISLVFYASGQ